MSDTVKAWIEERRAIHKAATGGPWETDQLGGSIYAGVADLLAGTATSEGYVRNEDDAAAIVDAHNVLPRALDALGQVLELHVKGYEAAGIHWCSECETKWPCATVQAIEWAIND